MRRWLPGIAVTLGLGLLLALLLAVVEQRSLVFTLGVPPTLGAPLTPGGEVCQGPIETPSSFERVQVQLGTPRAAAVPADVIVRDRRTRAPLATGQALAPFGGPRPVNVEVGHVGEGRRISVCVRNDGDRPLLVFGSPLAAPGSFASYEGERFQWDMSAALLRADGASLFSLAPDMVERAALFRGDWIGDFAVWIVLALLVTAFPLLLIKALRDVEA
jgi:hypothetical protein